MTPITAPTVTSAYPGHSGVEHMVSVFAGLQERKWREILQLSRWGKSFRPSTRIGKLTNYDLVTFVFDGFSTGGLSGIFVTGLVCV